MVEREGGLVVEQRGEQRVDDTQLSWYTAQPDPSHWIAVGSPSGDAAHTAAQVHVGIGRTEAEATADLLRSARSTRGALGQQAGADAAWIAEWSL